MVLERIRTGWRRLPQKKRVQIIASVLLIFAGTETLFLAPYVFDLALMIDVGGLVVVFSMLQSSLVDSLLQIRVFIFAITRPLLTVMKAIEVVTDFGFVFSPRWYHKYFLMERVVTRFSAALLVASVGLALTGVFIAHL
jgi:hypothetical protein